MCSMAYKRAYTLPVKTVWNANSVVYKCETHIVYRSSRHKKNEKDICLFIGWFVYDVLMLLISQNRGIFYCIYGNYERCHTAKRWLFKVFLIFIFSLFNIYERHKPIERSFRQLYRNTCDYILLIEICVLNWRVRARAFFVCTTNTLYTVNRSRKWRRNVHKQLGHSLAYYWALVYQFENAILVFELTYDDRRCLYMTLTSEWKKVSSTLMSLSIPWKFQNIIK